MKKSQLILQSFSNALGVFIYISAVAWLMNNGEKLFGKINNIWGPILILMLFVVSALATSTLVFGRPIYLYFNEQKRAGITLFFYTGAWLVAIMITVLSILIIKY
jgi:hypothetical protein